MENERHNDCSGYCRRCRTRHVLSQGNARLKAIRLIELLEQKKSVALAAGSSPDDPLLSTAPLFEDARGKMFGVLEGLRADGTISWLYAFSGQYRCCWQVPGWVPPLFNIDRFRALNDPVERQIKELGRQIAAAVPDSGPRRLLLQQRRDLARGLMKDIHALYRLTNFCGDRRALDTVLASDAGIPTGTGDCCAPKLLNQAALEGMAPLSLAEFYFGRENRSQTRQHGHFYAPCSSKCAPLLGFMLCGAAEKRHHYAGQPAHHS